MAGRGPAPKHSSQRRRRNSVEVDTVTADGVARGPELPDGHTQAAQDWYEALRRSGQASFYQPSDWAQAHLVAHAVDAFVAEPKAAMLDALNRSMTGLLATEAERRRARIELERASVPDDRAAAAVAELEEMRARRFG